MSESRLQGAVAIVALIGGFVLIGSYAVRGVPPDTSVMTLTTAIMLGVVGFYFGHRGVAVGVEKATNGMADMSAKFAAARDAQANGYPPPPPPPPPAAPPAYTQPPPQRSPSQMP